MEEYIILGSMCILGFICLLYYVSKQEGFEDLRMDLGDADRGSDAWYENGTRRAGNKSGILIDDDKESDKKDNTRSPNAKPQAQAPQRQAPQGQAPQGQAPQGQAPQGQAPQAQAPEAPQARSPPPINTPERTGAPARTADMPSISGRPVENTKMNYAPSNVTPTGISDPGPELTAANTVKPPTPQINSRVNEDMCRVVMNCGLTKL